MRAWAEIRSWFSWVQGPVSRSLSQRLLWLTILYVMMSALLVNIPSIVRHHRALLEQRLAAAQIAVLPLEETENNEVSPDLRKEVLANAGVEAVILRRTDTRRLFLADEEMPREVGRVYDLNKTDALTLIEDAVDAFIAPSGRTIRISGAPRLGGGLEIAAIMKDSAIREDLYAYAWGVLRLSIATSVITAALVYLSILFVFVRPIERLSRNMLDFRERPEDARRVMVPSGRLDEIGQAEATLSEMQQDLRAALHHQAHLAALGTSVAKINHDLRNILSSAQLASDRLATIEDPVVQKTVPRLMASLDRAIALTGETLKYARTDVAAPRRRILPLRPIVSEVFGTTARAGEGGAALENLVPFDLEIDADPELLFRILMNLTRNAVEAMASSPASRLTIRAHKADAIVMIDIEDNGPGIPKRALERLFQAFSGSARAGGTGLGLAIAKELAHAHGGDLKLVYTGSEGTLFRLEIPCREKGEA
ncbi:MAG: HAMP domain-containing histidine kinase [Alphaproteobacteria bacterium]|nr:HAMP domain-containing histidine kinase [Alphaproteobacteria bacterium]